MYEITKVAAIAAVSCVTIYSMTKRELNLAVLIVWLGATALLIWGANYNVCDWNQTRNHKRPRSSAAS